MHPADRPVWELTHADHLWDVDLEDGQTIKVGGAALKVIHTPGHAPGAICLYVHDLGCVFTGDTLFEGGPGATGRSFSDEDLIKESIRTRLFDLPDETVVHTGHGADTTIGAERANLGVTRWSCANGWPGRSSSLLLGRQPGDVPDPGRRRAAGRARRQGDARC